MRSVIVSLLSGMVLSLVTAPALSDPAVYRQEFMARVIQFANLNRMRGDIHRDIHVDCYIPVVIATTILSDGSVKDVSVVETSTVPLVDRYFSYIIEQAGPYQPLSTHYDPVPEDITIVEEFRLDVRLWSENVRSTRPCEKLEPSGTMPE